MDIAADKSDSKRQYLSGYFRDGVRRIDMVLVAKWTGQKSLERLKMQFLSNCLNMGLQIELEAGMNRNNNDLLFIKFHATDHLIKHFGYFYNMRKFFKRTHIEFVHSWFGKERELIKMMRRLYPGPVNYSNMERSVIMYKILLSVPFGTPANYVGVNQLLENNIFIDMYPLHDGPCHFFTGQSIIHMNGRQALFYSWANYANLFRPTPIHLVREYFGERVGFFFAFHQFYNFSLLALALISYWFFTYNYDIKGRNIEINEYGDKNLYKYKALHDGKVVVLKEYEDLPVCPKCKDFVACPFRYMTDYARELKCKVFLDSPYNYFLIYILFLWGVLLFIFWKRRENYLNWMWETYPLDAKILTRPSYRDFPKPKFKHEDKPKDSAVFMPGDKVKSPSWRVQHQLRHEFQRLNLVVRLKKTRQFVVIILILLFLTFIYAPLMIITNMKILNRLRYFEHIAKITEAIEQLNHFVIEVCGTLNGLWVLSMETIWWYIWKYLSRLDSPRSEFKFEQRHFLNLYAMSVYINFLMIFFYAWFKDIFRGVPNDPRLWDMPLGMGMLNCGLLTCTDECFIFMIATFKAKYCFEEILLIVQKRFQKTDSLKARYEDEPPDQTPVWEREFKLRPFTEDTVTHMYYRLFMQYTIVTLFLTSFQLGPLFAFFYNFWEVKYYAVLFTVHSRRPLLTQTWGLGGWENILFALPYMAALTNVVYMAKHNSLVHRRFNWKYWNHHAKRRFLADYYMAFFNISDEPLPDNVRQGFIPYMAKFNFNVPHFCMFSGQINRFITFIDNDKRILHVNMYTQLVGYYYIKWHQGCIVLFYVILTLLTGAFLNYIIRTKSKFVSENLYVEDAVKNYDITQEMAKKPVLRPQREDSDDYSE